MHRKPLHRTSSPFFGSGPVKKHNLWDIRNIHSSQVSRSHRSDYGVGRIQKLESCVRENMHVPRTHKICFINGSATAAMESALWNVIGQNNLTILDFDTFAKRWACDVIEQLKPNITIQNIDIPFGSHYQFEDLNPDHDLLFCWNGSTSGMMMPHLNWLQQNRKGLVICDATSAAYCSVLPFEQLDITAFSFQKGLGGEASIGCLIVSEKAYQHLMAYTPQWPIPRLFRLKDDGFDIFDGKLLNTPSMLCLEEIIYAHQLFQSTHSYDVVQQNKAIFQKCLDEFEFFENVVSDPLYRSCSTGVFKIVREQFKSKNTAEQYAILRKIVSLLGEEKIAYDFMNHPSQPPSLRIWLGYTMNAQDIEIAFSWLEWALQEALNGSC